MLRLDFFSITRVWRETAITVLILGTLLFFAYHFIQQEHFIYYWDFAGYWIRYRGFVEVFWQTPMVALYELVISIRNYDYNFFPVALLLPANAVLGSSRLGYILGNTILFTFPTVLLFGCFFKRRLSQIVSCKQNSVWFLVAIACAGFSPQLWDPVLSGYLGGGGLILALSVLVIYFRKPFSSQSYLAIVFMALLLCLMVIFRRWYVYWVAGFLLAITFDNILNLRNIYQSDFRKYLPVLVKLFVFGSAALGFFILFATPVAERILLTDYADIYSGYKYNLSFSDALVSFVRYFGLFTIVMASFGAFFLFRNEKSRSIAIVLFCQFWISFVLFNNTQDMGNHHYYILLPSLFFFTSYALVVVVSKVKRGVPRSGCLVTIFLLLMLNFSIVFNPVIAIALHGVDFGFPKLRHFPMNRQDIEEVHNILRYIEKQVSGHEKVYVLASGRILNDEILINGCKTSGRQYSICNNFATTAHVDKRDGLPLDLFLSQYIVTTEPAQFHLAEEDQQVVGVLRNMLLNRSGLGSNYKKLPVGFELDGNIKVSVYQKLSEKFTRADLQDLSDIFVKLYPRQETKFMFPADLFSQLTE